MSQAFPLQPVPGHLIDGRLVDGAAATVDVVNPATTRTIAQVALADIAQLEQAVAAAARAFEDAGWQDAATRAGWLERLADLLERDAEALGQLIIDEVGTPRLLIAALQIGAPIRILRYYAGLARQDLTRHLGPDGHATMPSESLVRYVPAGVAGIITAYNYPLLLLALKLGPAIAAGCTAVVMPSAQTPLATLRFGELVREAGLPPGSVNILVGDAEVARALTLHPAVERISFTGSVGIGKAVMRQAAEGLKGVTLELGGKSAAILLPEADLATVTPAVHARYLRNAGQGCASPTRILVPRARLDEFLAETRKAVAAIRVGDPNDPQVLVGPLISAAHRARVEGYVQRALAAGAGLVCGGDRPEGLAGWFLNPTVLHGLDNGFEIAREELFGPVGVILTYDTVDEAIAIANDSALGLAAAVYGPLAAAQAVARRLRVGSVYINGGGDLRMDAPMGGFKQSGLGREYGPEGLMEYLEPQHIQWAAG